jgi:hypothetical protein
MKFGDFQRHVYMWMQTCFGPRITDDADTRLKAFIEESVELVQAGGLSKEDVLKIVDYTYGRPVGEIAQEAGGVMIALAGVCTRYSVSIHDVAQLELGRCITNTAKIREKQKMKVAAGIRTILPPDTDSPLPPNTATHTALPLLLHNWQPRSLTDPYWECTHCKDTLNGNLDERINEECQQHPGRAA